MPANLSSPKDNDFARIVREVVEQAAHTLGPAGLVASELD
jgi:hypothetical protein